MGRFDEGNREMANDLADDWAPRLREMSTRVRNGGLKPKRALDDAGTMFCKVIDAPLIDVDALMEVIDALESESDPAHVANALMNMAVMVRQYASGELQGEG